VMKNECFFVCDGSFCINFKKRVLENRLDKAMIKVK